MNNLKAEITHEKFCDDYNANESTKPLLVLLHGWGSNEHDLPGLADALSIDIEYVAVRAPFSADSPGIYDGGYAWGYAWFFDPVVAHSERDAQAKIAGDAFISWLETQQNTGKINPGRPLIILGFSQGGAMCTHLMLREELKSRLVGVAMLSGYLPFDISNQDIKPCNAKLPVFHGWGDADDIVAPKESEQASKWFADNFDDVTDKTYSGMMHSIRLDEVNDLRVWLKARA